VSPLLEQAVNKKNIERISNLNFMAIIASVEKVYSSEALQAEDLM